MLQNAIVIVLACALWWMLYMAFYHHLPAKYLRQQRLKFNLDQVGGLLSVIYLASQALVYVGRVSWLIVPLAALLVVIRFYMLAPLVRAWSSRPNLDLSNQPKVAPGIFLLVMHLCVARVVSPLVIVEVSVGSLEGFIATLTVIFWLILLTRLVFTLSTAFMWTPFKRVIHYIFVSNGHPRAISGLLFIVLYQLIIDIYNSIKIAAGTCSTAYSCYDAEYIMNMLMVVLSSLVLIILLSLVVRLLQKLIARLI